MSTEPNSGLYDFRNFTSGQSGWADEMISNMLRIGRVGFQILVQDKDLQEPDSAVTYSDGDTYLVASGATGAWASQDNNIAVWDAAESEWVFYTPREGWRVAVQDEEVDYRYAVDSGTGWIKQPTARIDNSVDFSGDVSVAGAADITGNATVSGTLSVTSTIASGDINVTDPVPVLTLKDSNSVGAAQSGFVRYLDSGDNETAYFGFGSSTNTKFYVGNTIGDILLYSPSPVTACVDIDGNVDALALRVNRAGTTVTDSITEFVSDSGGADTTVCKVLVDGDLENINNSYGAISDRKLKQNIVDATPKLADLLQLKIRHYELKSKPGEKLIGLIHDELEQVFPGMVKYTPDYETVPDPDWTPGVKKKPVFETVKMRRAVISLIDGKYVKQIKTIEEKRRVYDEFPVYDEFGELTGEIHRVLRHVEEPETEEDRPMITRPAGTYTASIKYSVFVPMLIKAVQELYGMLDQGNANTLI